MPSTFSDVLLAPAATIAGQWIQVVNNETGVGYVSTAATTSPGTLTGGGVYTFNPGPPADIYTVYTSPVQLAPLAGGWIPTGNSHYVIAYTAGDDMVMHSGTSRSGGPYSAIPGGNVALAADTTALTRLGYLGRTDAILSSARSDAQYSDATQFNEAWANLTNWIVGEIQVSAGGVYASDASPSTGGTHQITVTPGTTRYRVRASITVVGGGNSNAVFVGFTKAGAAACTTANSVGIGIFGLEAMYMDRGSFSVTLGAVVAGTYYITAIIDETNISVTLTDQYGTAEAHYSVPLATFGTPTGIAVYNSDSRQLTGNYIGQLTASSDTVSCSTRTVEITSPSVSWTPDANSQSFHVALPIGYDARKPVPTLLYCHPRGGTEMSVLTESQMYNVYTNLLANGIAVVSHNQHGNGWGNQQSLDDMAISYRYIRDHYNLGPVVLAGASMGGVASLNIAQQRVIPGVVGWIGWYPICSLIQGYTIAGFSADINTAYGITQQSQIPSAYDPLQQFGYAFRGIPMRFYASSGDTTAVEASNSTPMAALVLPYTTEAVVVQCTGGHGDVSHYQPSDVLAFVQRVTAT